MTIASGIGSAIGSAAGASTGVTLIRALLFFTISSAINIELCTVCKVEGNKIRYCYYI